MLRYVCSSRQAYGTTLHKPVKSKKSVIVIGVTVFSCVREGVQVMCKCNLPGSHNSTVKKRMSLHNNKFRNVLMVF